MHREKPAIDHLARALRLATKAMNAGKGLASKGFFSLGISCEIGFSGPKCRNDACRLCAMGLATPTHVTQGLLHVGVFTSRGRTSTTEAVIEAEMAIRLPPR